MRIALRELTEQYSAALREYCAEGGEAALFQAYQLGRRAAGNGVGVLEIAALHQEALVAALLEMLAIDESTRIAQRASEFFAECLAPFELTRRSYQEGHATLRDLNQELEQRLNAALHNSDAARDQLLEHRMTDQLKNDLMTVMSHEIPTPVMSIHDSLRQLKSGVGGDLNAQGHRLLDVACRNSQQLMRLVDDLLDVRRIELGTMIVDMTKPAPAGSGSGSP
jgi:signal transduction histidine kinase